MTPKVALIMGSDSDFEKLKSCVAKLKEFKIEVDVNVISAHRTPDKAAEFAKNAEKNGIEVIICAAGMAHFWQQSKCLRVSLLRRSV